MSQAAETLISLLLPEGILDYFELTQVEKEGKMLNIYLEEKNIVPEGYQKGDLESKGFFPEVSRLGRYIPGSNTSIPVF